MHILLHTLPLIYVIAQNVPISVPGQHNGGKLNAAIQQFITPKISVCAFIHGSKTHLSLLQSNLQLLNDAAIMHVEYQQLSIESGRPVSLTDTAVCKIESF